MVQERKPSLDIVVPSLHDPASRGNLQGVQKALAAGADVNALNDKGWTVLTCTIAGNDWSIKVPSKVPEVTQDRIHILRAILRHPSLSLLTMNAPLIALNGVTPLGFAAWLNSPLAVSALLKYGMEAVAVDGMDSNRATPLMYAARDGNLDVVGILLSYGAHPDSRDANHRTPIHFALPHPSILWLLESVLRLRRWQDYEKRKFLFPSLSRSDKLRKAIASSFPSFDPLIPPPSFSHQLARSTTKALIQATSSNNLTALQHILFQPNGAATPSSSSAAPPSPQSPTPPPLVNLPDENGWSPIHHCVAVACPSVAVLDALYMAGADVSLYTTDEQQYTPLHILALCASPPSGTRESAHALYSFTMHLVQDLHAPLAARDVHDNTCLHLAARGGRTVDVLLALLDCDATGYARGLRNADGLTAAEVSKPEFRGAFTGELERLYPKPIPPIEPSPSRSSISSLRWIGPALPPGLPPPEFDLRATAQRLLHRLRLTSGSFPDPVPVQPKTVLWDTQQLADSILAYFRSRSDRAKSGLEECKLRMRQATALLELVLRGLRSQLEERGARFQYEMPGLVGGRRSEDSQVTAVSGHRRWAAAAMGGSGSEPDAKLAHSGGARRPWSSWLDLRASSKDREGTSKTVAKKRKEAATKSTAAKLASWLKRKMMLGRVQEERGGEGGPALDPPLPPPPPPPPPPPRVLTRRLPRHDHSVDRVYKAAPVLAVAKRDLDHIIQHISEADRYLASASQAIVQVERLIQKALKKRNDVQDRARRTVSAASPGLKFSKWVAGSTLAHYSPSLFTAASSNASLSSTLVESDDEETRALQRLVLRKIEAKIDGALTEVDKVNVWLRSIKEVLRGVKRKASL